MPTPQLQQRCLRYIYTHTHKASTRMYAAVRLPGTVVARLARPRVAHGVGNRSCAMLALSAAHLSGRPTPCRTPMPGRTLARACWTAEPSRGTVRALRARPLDAAHAVRSVLAYALCAPCCNRSVQRVRYPGQERVDGLPRIAFLGARRPVARRTHVGCHRVVPRIGGARRDRPLRAVHVDTAAHVLRRRGACVPAVMPRIAEGALGHRAKTQGGAVVPRRAGDLLRRRRGFRAVIPGLRCMYVRTCVHACVRVCVCVRVYIERSVARYVDVSKTLEAMTYQLIFRTTIVRGRTAALQS